MTKIYINTSIENDKVIKSANSDNGKLPEFWFKFPLSVKDDLTDRADPFVHALIFPMMEQGGEFEIIGNVSKSVLLNMAMFCRIWNIWCPDKYKPIFLKAKERASPLKEGMATIPITDFLLCLVASIHCGAPEIL